MHTWSNGITRFSMRQISEKANIEENREAWLWTIYIPKILVCILFPYIFYLFSNWWRKAMPKILQMATILHEVLKTVVDDPMKVDSKVGFLLLLFAYSNFFTHLVSKRLKTWVFNWFWDCRQKDMLQMLRRKRNCMNPIIFFHCMQQGLNRKLWTFLRLLKCILCNFTHYCIHLIHSN